MSEMVERIARKLYFGEQPFDNQAQIAWANDERGREICERMARWCLETLREPTDAMLDAARDKVCVIDGETTNPLDTYIAGKAWSAMIDAALADDAS